MNNILLVYITCKDKKQAEKISRQLLEKRLAACINIIDGVSSLYLWPPQKNTIETATEVLLVIKTIENKFKELENEIVNMHSYSTPEIIATPVVQVNKKYSDWLIKELE